MLVRKSVLVRVGSAGLAGVDTELSPADRRRLAEAWLKGRDTGVALFPVSRPITLICIDPELGASYGSG